MRRLCRCGLLIKVERMYKMNIIWCVFSICMFCPFIFLFLPLPSYSLSPSSFSYVWKPSSLEFKPVGQSSLPSPSLQQRAHTNISFFLQVLSEKWLKWLSSLLLHQSVQRLPSFIFVPGSCIKDSVHQGQEGVLETSLPFAGIPSCYTAWGIKLAQSDGPYTALTLTCTEEGNH